MPKKLTKTDLVPNIIALWETKSPTQAAKVLGVSRDTYNHRLKRIKQLFGEIYANHRASGIRFTDFGEQLYYKIIETNYDEWESL